jgi:ferredoxin
MIRINQELCTDCGICGDVYPPDDWEVYASITMGYPKYKFRRIAPRKLAEARYLS